MKKTLLRILPVFLALALFVLPVLASPPLDDPPYVIYVTIIDGDGNHVVDAAQFSFGPTATLDDALRAAHEAHHQDGAEGYGSEETAYGVSLTKLWGDDSGAFGYQVLTKYSGGKPVPVASLADTFEGGSYLFAYAYTDTAGFSDVFSYFERISFTGAWKDPIVLDLKTVGFDENWNPVSTPLAGAAITINGKPTELVTDENGRVTIETNKVGTLHISAEKESMTLISPYTCCKVKPAPVFYLVPALLAVIIGIAVLIVKKHKKADQSASMFSPT